MSQAYTPPEGEEDLRDFETFLRDSIFARNDETFADAQHSDDVGRSPMWKDVRRARKSKQLLKMKKEIEHIRWKQQQLQQLDEQQNS